MNLSLERILNSTIGKQILAEESAGERTRRATALEERAAIFQRQKETMPLAQKAEADARAAVAVARRALDQARQRLYQAEQQRFTLSQHFDLAVDACDRVLRETTPAPLREFLAEVGDAEREIGEWTGPLPLGNATREEQRRYLAEQGAVMNARAGLVRRIRDEARQLQITAADDDRLVRKINDLRADLQGR